MNSVPLRWAVRNVLYRAAMERYQQENVVMLASEFFDSEEEFETIYEQAEANASTDAEMKFVDDINTACRTYGYDKLRMSERQADWLKKIARAA